MCWISQPAQQARTKSTSEDAIYAETVAPTFPHSSPNFKKSKTSIFDLDCFWRGLIWKRNDNSVTKTCIGSADDCPMYIPISWEILKFLKSRWNGVAESNDDVRSLTRSSK